MNEAMNELQAIVNGWIRQSLAEETPVDEVYSPYYGA